MMKKAGYFFLVCGLLFMLCGCSEKTENSSETEGASMIPNPVKEVTLEEMIELTGISLPANENMEEVQYSVIQLEGEEPIAQMDFNYQGKACFLRAQATGEFEAGDICGLHYEWEVNEQAMVGYCEANIYLKEFVGYIAWLDIAPGIQYNLGMTESADAEILTTIANAVFVPLQGED